MQELEQFGSDCDVSWWHIEKDFLDHSISRVRLINT